MESIIISDAAQFLKKNWVTPRLFGTKNSKNVYSLHMEQNFNNEHFMLRLGVGRVSFSALGSGFGFLDFARVGFRVKEIWFGSSSDQFFFSFFSQFWLYLATN